MNPYIFREYDIRGIVKTDLTDDTVFKIGQSFATLLLRKGGKSASVGGDIRHSTNHLKDVLINGMLSTGLNVVDLGQCPTGAQYFSHFHLDVDGGVMITGSHNPPEYNGFKLTQFKSNMFGEAIQDIYTTAKANDFEAGEGTCSSYDINTPYIQDVRHKTSLKHPLKIVMDSGNGASALVVDAIFKDIENLDLIHIFGEPDGDFPNHHPDPTVEKNLVALKAKVAETGADFGIGYDGDADRIGVIDKNGQIIWGDKLLIIYALHALKKEKQQIVFDVKCSKALIEEIEKAGGTPIMSATGHSLLKKKMKEIDAKVAGEMSGHMFFGDENYGYDDAIYAAARLISIIAEDTKPIHEYLKDITPYVATPEIRLEAENDEVKFEITKKAVQYFTENYTCSTVDGVRIDFGDGWGLVRSSNTQPVIVVRMEAQTSARLEEIKQLVINKLSEYGHLVEGGH